SFRPLFEEPEDRVYLDGHSLGLLCRPAAEALERALAEWRRSGVSAWLDSAPPWFLLAEDLAARMAPLLGAAAEPLIVPTSTTVNLHQLLAALFEPRPGRDRILIDALCFPSDAYAVQSHLRVRGLDPERHLVQVPSADGLTLDEAAIVDSLSDHVHLA